MLMETWLLNEKLQKEIAHNLLHLEVSLMKELESFLLSLVSMVGKEETLVKILDTKRDN